MEPGAISRVLVIGRRLRVDGWTAEAVTALTEASVATVLLKGPATARWLYPVEPENRGYNDVDLLVEPAQLEAAHAVLAGLGYVRLPHPELDRHILHALPYERPGDRASIDLHRTLHGLQGVPDTFAWQVVSRNGEVMEVGGVSCSVPSVPVRIVHLILHLSHEDSPSTQPWQDLQRALDRCSDTEWDAAAAVARELTAENEVALRLRRMPDGARRADALGLPAGGSPYYLLREAFETGRAPESVQSLYALKALPNRRARVAYVRGKFWPSADRLRARYPRERGILRVRLGHISVMLRRLPGAIAGWRRYYRP